MAKAPRAAVSHQHATSAGIQMPPALVSTMRLLRLDGPPLAQVRSTACHAADPNRSACSLPPARLRHQASCRPHTARSTLYPQLPPTHRLTRKPPAQVPPSHQSWCICSHRGLPTGPLAVTFSSDLLQTRGLLPPSPRPPAPRAQPQLPGRPGLDACLRSR